jgi:hypothetical protein
VLAVRAVLKGRGQRFGFFKSANNGLQCSAGNGLASGRYDFILGLIGWDFVLPLKWIDSMLC